MEPMDRPMVAKELIGYCFKQSDSDIKPIKPPMSDMEFHNYLDSAGFMMRPNEFRLSIYQGGIEPSLRRVAWRHLLNIFPANMSGNDRYEYMKRKGEEYRRLREEWREKFKSNTATEEVKYVTSMVKKDVLRTDRAHDFYKGSQDNEDNENTLSLFHLLVTYALTHPDVSYCQGMSDLASPLLVTQKDEGQASICFCALMNRLRENFTVEGTAIMLKFRHLSEVLAMYDPQLHAYLEQNSAGDMFFCYRWFLLELKREFPFSDALYVLEVMWATLPPSPPQTELELVDPVYSCRLLSTSPCTPSFSIKQAMYAKLLAMRRVGALHRVAQAAKPITLHAPRPSTNNNLSLESCHDSSNNTSVMSSFDTSPGDIEDKGSDFPEVDNVLTRSLQKKSSSIDQVLQEGSCLGDDDDEDADDENENKTSQSSCDTDSDSKKNNLDNPGSGVDSSPKENGFDSLDTIVPEDSEYGGVSMHIPSNSIPIEESSDFHFTKSNGERTWSVSSAVSESSDGSELQAQFVLSLDTNSNNSENTCGQDDQSSELSSVPTTPETTTSNVVYIKAEAPANSKAVVANNSDSNSGIFQSMKRLLASPIRRSTSHTTPDVPTSPGASPKKGMPPKHVPSAPVLHGVSSNKDVSAMAKNYSDSHLSECQEATESLESSTGSAQTTPSSPSAKPVIRDPSRLPPPQEFGSGNPFLMFLCLTLLTMHRDVVVRNGMCYEEIAMHFDRLVRRHNAQRVLHHARQMYTEYLKAQQNNVEKEREKEVDELGMSC
ncbi:TBC1 domain family member 25 [Aplysia californica]|uniref:TBC1 domain family member 25 n=1 Tax=Aplysia californica TaxID=6500 RepID=A0ABM0JEB3_APLCA|nr:TBC1 domain family member 25 [Aplysia californica]